jgi:hypothetical protein
MGNQTSYEYGKYKFPFVVDLSLTLKPNDPEYSDYRGPSAEVLSLVNHRFGDVVIMDVTIIYLDRTDKAKRISVRVECRALTEEVRETWLEEARKQIDSRRAIFPDGYTLYAVYSD